MKRIALIASLLFSTCLLTSPAESATQTFEHSEQVQAGRFQLPEEVSMLAHLRSIRQTQEQAGQYLYSLPEVNKHFSREQANALATALYDLEVFPLNAGREIKAKLFVDTDVLPEDLWAFHNQNPLMIESILNHTLYVAELEQQLASYLQELSQTSSESHAQLLRESKGTKLKARYQSNDLFVEGTRLLNRKRMKESIQTLTQSIALAPDYYAGYVMRAIAHLAESQFDASLKDMNQAIALKSDLEGLYFLRGAVYVVQGVLLNKGLEDLNKAIAMNPQNNQSYYLRGVIFQRQGQCSAAKRDYVKACELGHKRSCNLDCGPPIQPKGLKDLY